MIRLALFGLALLAPLAQAATPAVLAAFTNRLQGLDGRFVQRAMTERKAETILRISITIGLTLGMGVVAEGVETADQIEFLRGCGGTIVQGYHLARPMPVDSCTAWLQRATF